MWNQVNIFNHINKTKGRVCFNSYRAFNRALWKLKAPSNKAPSLESVIIFMNQTSNKYGTPRANMSMDTNKGAMMRCKTITAKLLKISGLLVEASKYLAKAKASLE